MTDALAFRGPDAREAWSREGAGLGHTLLRTTDEALREHQPLSFGGDVWITADARIDARPGLIAKLRDAGRDVAADAPDVDLILHAYHAWGEACMTHLLGDFAFAIWDARAGRLFCARDHFGIKPFFYARAGEALVFSNTLDCVRMHPGVAADLNELAVADFLLFGENLEPDTTVFAAVMRLPAGHCLAWSRAGLQVRAYWTLDRNLPIVERSPREQVARFRALFELAVSDRLRTGRIGIEMTGGMDSTSVAVTARQLLARSGRAFGMSAHTSHFEHVVPDREGEFAALVAREAGFPITLHACDAYPLFGRFDDPHTHQPEPYHEPLYAHRRDVCLTLPAQGRVFFTGWEGDAMLNESPKPYFRRLLREGRWPLLLSRMAAYAVSQRRWFPLAWRDRLLGRKGRSAGPAPEFPRWIAEPLAQRLDLRARWDAHHAKPRGTHPLRPYAYAMYDYLQRASNHFDHYDAAITRQPVEYRHPMMDVRLVEFCLSLPPAPWCVRKRILRLAMKGLLPEAVRRRPKTPQGTRYIEVLLERDRAAWEKGIEASPALQRFVDLRGLGLNCPQAEPMLVWRDLRVLSLDFWLRSLKESPGEQ
nr:asparagine synthase-related protein [Caenimonas aquaedulcis]